MTTTWQQYVTRLCNEAWHLQANATNEILAKLEALVTARVLTEPAVATVLHRAGLSWAAADAIAPSIRSAASPSRESLADPLVMRTARLSRGPTWRIGVPERLHPAP